VLTRTTGNDSQSGRLPAIHALTQALSLIKAAFPDGLQDRVFTWCSLCCRSMRDLLSQKRTFKLQPGAVGLNERITSVEVRNGKTNHSEAGLEIPQATNGEHDGGSSEIHEESRVIVKDQSIFIREVEREGRMCETHANQSTAEGKSVKVVSIKVRSRRKLP
jgi:hypothetical protein